MNIPRKPAPKKFLDASLVPLEQALLERAKKMAEQVRDQTFTSSSPSDEEIFKTGVSSLVRATIASEFQKLADELHHW